jgi:uncharacterized protein YpbB
MSRPAEETIRLLREGNSLEEVARIRGRQLGSIATLVADLIQEGALELQPGWVAPAKRIQIEEACAKLGIERLRPIKDALPEEIAFEDIRLVVAQMQRQQQQSEESPRVEETARVKDNPAPSGNHGIETAPAPNGHYVKAQHGSAG